MELFTALHSRRSIRAYTNESLSHDELKKLIDAAMIAPSAGNARPWQFIVIDDRALLAKIPLLNQYAGMAPAAAAGILVCGDLGREKYPGFWVQDCSAAIQNLLLAATALGIGSVWTGIYPVEERVRGFSELFALPQTIVPLAFIALGRPKKDPETLNRYEPERVHHNGFGAPWK